MTCRHYVISGRVQGVYFRASARGIARTLRLTGWVRNLADGRVEAIACGESAALDEFGRWLTQGPPHARVADVAADDIEPRVFADFVVR